MKASLGNCDPGYWSPFLSGLPLIEDEDSFEEVGSATNNTRKAKPFTWQSYFMRFPMWVACWALPYVCIYGLTDIPHDTVTFGIISALLLYMIFGTTISDMRLSRQKQWHMLLGELYLTPVVLSVLAYCVFAISFVGDKVISLNLEHILVSSFITLMLLQVVMIILFACKGGFEHLFD